MTKRQIIKMLRTEETIVCLNPQAQAIFASVGLEMALSGKLVKAQLVKGWKDKEVAKS